MKIRKERKNLVGISNKNNWHNSNEKKMSINRLEPPKTLKQLRSFMGCIHHLIKFTPRLAELSEPRQPLISKLTTKSKTN